MPHIFVQYRPLIAKADRGYLLREIRGRLMKSAAIHLSVNHRPLTEEDFSVTFMEAGEWDTLVHDIQVIILAHADKERVEKSDSLAEVIATSIEEAILFELPAPDPPHWISFSVSLHLGEMGYFASSEKIGDDGSS